MTLSKRIGLILLFTLLVCMGTMLLLLLIKEENHKKTKVEENLSELSQTIKESVMFSMSQGISDLTPYIERARKIENIHQLRIIPTNYIEKSSEDKMDSLERDILRTKKKIFLQESFNGEPVFRTIDPILAEEGCLTCHDVKVNDPLAVISLRYSMSETYASISTQRFSAIGLSVGAIIITFLIMMWCIRKKVINDLQKSVSQIKKLASGDISENESINRTDELGVLFDSIYTLRTSMEAHSNAANEIANGNLNTEIKILSDKDKLGTAMLGMKENLKDVINDMNNLVYNTVNGNLSTRADVTNYKGDFKNIIVGINKTLDGIIIPIKDGVEVLSGIAQGDFSQRIITEYKGDHQLIKNSINTVAESLSEILSEVSQVISTTASAASQISSSSEQMAAGVQEQNTQTNEVASAMEEMTKTIFDTTTNSSSAAEAAKKSGTIAKEGGEVVGQTINGMNRIAEVVKKSAETVHALGKNSNKIGEIVQVIDDIADQTNLLALNAAIEAARAGEQGRGFAVVADEVRKLAERTTKATKEIAAMIIQIQKDTDDAVISMNQGTDEVEKGKILADKASVSLKEIINGAEKVVDISTQVAAASEEQSATAEQISRNIELINNVSQQNTAGIQQITSAAGDLNKLTLSLQELISKFRIENSTLEIHKSEKSKHLSVRSNGKLINS